MLGGSSAEEARDFFAALVLRFGVAERDARFSAIRPQLVRHALTPSRLWSDTTVWTSRTTEIKTVSIAGSRTADRYLLSAQAAVPSPAVPGGSRHVMNLRRVADGIYRWDSTDEVAVGKVRPEEVFALISRAIAAMERPAPGIRAEYATRLPRTTATLGRLFTLDTLISLSGTDGSRIVSLAARADPDRMRRSAPLYADYLDEYLSPLRIELTLLDQRQRSWGTARFRDNVLSLRFRTREGMLQPLALEGEAEGAGRRTAVPDSLRLRISFFARVLFFTVGTSELDADLVELRAEGVRGWSLRFRREPRWHFPLAMNNLVRATLRRPFAGDGTTLEYLVRTTEVGQTVLARNIGITVEESTIVRWLGSLGATAVSDLTSAVETEKDRFYGEVIAALGDDTMARLAPRP
jgi:hypothetical protein